jgi:uncharacterized protein (DUF111 family)
MCEHGRVPVPAPATALLLRGARVRMGPVDAELVTPTGAALLATLVDDWSAPVPGMRLERVGTGAGAREFADHPNVVRLLVGEETAPAAPARMVSVLETALDDENPQYLADLVPRLLAAGALDAMLVPAFMKKGRPGHWLVVVAEPSISEQLAGLILASTSTLGVRIREERRIELARALERVQTTFGVVTVKVATLADGSRRAHAEYESVREVAQACGRPPRDVAGAAEAAWRALSVNR